MPPDETLRRRLAWLQAVLCHPGGIAEAVAAPAAQAALPVAFERLGEVVASTPAWSAADRLAVYAQAYYLRLGECLREEYPVLLQAVGRQTMDAFALAYLQDHPSTSYTLGELGREFPGWLARTRPADLPGGSWPDFLVDLARLERALVEVFDGPGGEDLPPLAAERLAGLSSRQWAQARLVPAPCLRVLAFAFPVSGYHAAVRRGEAPAVPPPQASYLAISRRDYVVRRYDLGGAQHALLAAILAGRNVAQALAAAEDHLAELGDDASALLHDWFRTWMAEGLFVDLA